MGRLAMAGALMVLGGALLAGCSSSPRYAGILVATAPPGASCALIRAGQQIATAEPTPAIALVDPAVTTDITVTCRRYAFEEATAVVPPRASSIYEQRIDIAMTPRPPGGR